jgi:hypothetical protein
LADLKTSKNRAKRQKKKERSKAKGSTSENGTEGTDKPGTDSPIKKRRLVNGKELLFRRPGEDSEGEEGVSETQDAVEEPNVTETGNSDVNPGTKDVSILDGPRIMIHEED